MNFPIFEFFWKSLTARSNVGTINDPNHASTRQALDYINTGAVDVGHMITHTFAFEDVIRSLRTAPPSRRRRGQNCGRYGGMTFLV